MPWQPEISSDEDFVYYSTCIYLHMGSSISCIEVLLNVTDKESFIILFIRIFFLSLQEKIYKDLYGLKGKKNSL